MSPLALFFLFKNILGIWGLLRFHMDRVLYFCKKKIGILIATVLDLSVTLGGIDILTILNLLIHWE